MKFDYSLASRLSKQQLFVNKFINPSMLEHISQQIRIGDSLAIARNAFIGSDVLSAVKSLTMETGLAKGISGTTGIYNNVQGLIGPLINSTVLESALTKNLQRAVGLAGDWNGIAEMANGIQGVMRNTGLQTGIVNASSLLSESVVSMNKYNSLFSVLNNFTSTNSFSSLFQEIDWSSLKEINFDNLSEVVIETEIGQEDSSDLLATIEVSEPKKTLNELTVEDLEKLLKKSIKPAGILSLSALFWNIFNEYIKDISFLIMELVLALMISFTIGNFNAEVIEKIEERIVESKTVRDVRKVTSKYLNTVPLYGEQLAFLRTDAILREGRFSTAPAIEKVSVRTVLFIVGRKGNWLQVQVETENDCFIGWVEESKVMKFKRSE